MKIYCDIKNDTEMTIGDRLDMLNGEIESLQTTIEESEHVSEQLEFVAAMVNKGRFYTTLSTHVVLTDIWQRLEEWEERFVKIEDKL
jgi:hypothetical protein